jgi:thymidylate synthase
MNEVQFSELDYMGLLQRIIDTGVDTPDRTGIGCRKVLNHQIVWGGGEFPFSTTRMLSPRLAWEEMSLFINGESNTKKLEEKKIFFWQGNTSREFLDNRGLQHLPEGDLGASYSSQFRKAGASVSPNHVDQLKNLVDGLRDNPYSRRHAIDLWGITEQHHMPLLPCWWRSNWSVLPAKNGKKELHLKLYSRSNDLVFGYWFAAMQYRMLQMAIAELLGYEVGLMVTDLWDVHVYHNQLEYAKEILSRDYGSAGTVSINKELNSFDDLLDLEYSDFGIEGYEPNREKFVTPRPEIAI